MNLHTPAYGQTGRAASAPSKASLALAIAFHGAVICISDTHSRNAGTRTSGWLRILSATDATLLIVGALVARF